MIATHRTISKIALVWSARKTTLKSKNILLELLLKQLLQKPHAPPIRQIVEHSKFQTALKRENLKKCSETDSAVSAIPLIWSARKTTLKKIT